MKIKSNCGQNMMEYTIIMGVIITVFLAMNNVIKRQAQAMIKTVADQIGNQKNADQDFSEETGYLMRSYTAVDSVVDKHIQEGRGGQRGVTDIFYGDRSIVSTNTLTLLTRVNNASL